MGEKRAQGTALLVLTGNTAIRLRGGAQDYGPGEIPAGTYPIVGQGFLPSDTVTCPEGQICTVDATDGKVTVSLSPRL